MLLKRAVLDRIAAGEVDLVFRRWARPTVRTGGQLRTAIGMLDIVSVDTTSLRAITAADAHRAGFGTRAELLDVLAAGRDGTLYRVQVRPGGPDPRLELRERTDFAPDELADVLTRLEHLDRAPRGPWTRRTLRLLADNPHVRAPDLAEREGLDTKPFKTDIRKLKALGLTISHSPGYELSPRGHALLAHLDTDSS